MFKFFFAWNAWIILKLPLTIFALTILFFVIRFMIRMNLKKKHYRAQNIQIVNFMGASSGPKIAEIQEDPVNPLRDAIKKNKDAKAFLLQLGPIMALNLVDPEYIKDFSNKVLVDFDRVDSQKTFELLMKNGITGLNGEDYKLHRKIFANCFNFDTFEKNLVQCQAIAIECFESLNEQELRAFLVKEQLRKVFSGITAQNFFGENIDKQSLGGKSAYECRAALFLQMNNMCYNPLVMIAGPGIIKKGLLGSHRVFLANKKKYYAFLQQKIEEKRIQLEKERNGKGPCMLEAFLNAQEEFPDRGAVLDDESIAGEYINLLFSGNDMVALLLAETLYYLSLYPELTLELLQEIQRHIPNGKVTSINQLNNLDLMHSTLKEVLRLLAPVGITVKQAIHDTKILDLKVRKGDYVGIGIQANNSNPKYWDDPEKFNPKRFMKGAPSSNKEPFAFLSFSYGRDCVGQQFALIQAKLVLVIFLTTFDFRLEGSYKMRLGFQVLYEPVVPVKLFLTRKK